MFSDAEQRCRIDQCFVVDHSGSMRESNVGSIDNRQFIIDFTMNVARQLNIGPGGTRVAAVGFGERYMMCYTICRYILFLIRVSHACTIRLDKFRIENNSSRKLTLLQSCVVPIDGIDADKNAAIYNKIKTNLAKYAHKNTPSRSYAFYLCRSNNALCCMQESFLVHVARQWLSPLWEGISSNL